MTSSPNSPHTVESGHTSGEWKVTRSKMAVDGAFDYAISAEGFPVLAEAFGRTSDGGRPNAEANARLIAAAPDLKKVASNFEISGPDADGFVWLILHGKGTTGQAMVNLGTADRITAQVALMLEEDRKSAIRRTTGEN